MNGQRKIFSRRLVVQFLLIIVIFPFLPLLISWRWNWWEAWVYGSIWVLGFVLSRLLAARRHPDLLAERFRGLAHENAKAWDKRLAPLVAFGSGLIPLVAGLEVRFGDAFSFGPLAKGLALLLILGGYALGSYAMIENRFFSGLVRIQSERGHRVVSSGPYRWMRHPGYAGALLTYLVSPIFLDAPWAFVPATLLTALLVIRTRLEDNTLQEELDGYRDYAARVRYRLLPRVW